MKPPSRAPAHCRGLPLIAAALLAAPWCAQAAARLTEIIALAQANDPQYAAARASMAAGQEKYVQGRAGLLPTLTTQGSARAIREANTSHPDWVNYKSGTASITFTQPLLRKANYEAFRQGELQAQLAELQFKLAEQDLLVRISKGYFDVLQAQDVLASVRAQKDAFAQQLAQANKSFTVGVSPITDVNEAQSRYDLTLAQEIAALNDLEVKRRTLEKSVKTRLPELATLDEAAMVDILKGEQLDALVERAPNDALQVAIGLTTEQIARRDVAKESAGHWPTVDLVASKNENEHTSYSVTGPLSTRQTAVGVEVALPLFQGGAVSSRAREAAANLERTKGELETARRQATFEAGQAMLGVQSGLAMNRALKQALRSNEVQIRSTRRGLEVGVRTRVDVLNAEQQLYATKKDLAAARYQTVVSGLQLKAAAGVLTLDDLKEIDQLLTDQ